MNVRFLAGMAEKLTAPSFRDRIFSFADQGLQGLSNIVMTIVLARNIDVVQFASIGLMIGLYYFIFSFHRSCVVLPYILDASEHPHRPEERSEWWTLSLLFSAGGAVSVALLAGMLHLAGTLAGVAAWVVEAVFYLSWIVFPMLSTEFGRRACYQSGHPRTAAAISAVYFVVGVGMAAGASWAGSVALGAAAFAVAGLAATALFLLLRRPTVVGVAAAFRRWIPHAGFSLWQCLTSVFFVLYTTSAVVLVALFAGPHAAAIYTAARTLVNPAISVVSAVDSLDKPRAARALGQRGMEGLRASIGQTRRLLILLTGGYLGLIFLLAPWFLGTFFGEAYASNATEVRILALAFFLMCLNQPTETLLIVLRSSRLLFWIRFGGACTATLGIWLGAELAGTLGVVTAIACVQMAVLAALRVAEHIATQRKT